MVQASVAAALTLSLLLSLPVGAMAGDETGSLLTTVLFERSLHFQTPAGESVVVPSGIYAVKAEGQQGLRLEGKGQAPWLVQAMAGSHQVTLNQPFALALPDESSPQLTHLGLLLPDGHLLQSTGSADGVMPRALPTHIIVAMFKNAMTGSPVKPAMQVDRHSTRAGKPYRTYQLFAGMCTMLCERDEDCRAFNWSGNLTKPLAGTCQLMKDVPPKQDDDCCVSGAKPVARKK